MYALYRTLTSIVSPLMPVVLKRRLAQGKEDAGRMGERLGVPSQPRPQGKLVWIHAASVGEANAALPLIEMLLEKYAGASVLLTTVTVTSAALMAKRLPQRALHQFAPIDTPAAVASFVAHWRPDIALWVDSELWPNLIMQTHKSGAVLGIINARMSERSFKRWALVPSFIRPMLASFTLCFAQSEADGERLRALGIPTVNRIGNLKYDAPPLAHDEAEFARLKAAVGKRDVWLAASTHPGEEKQLAGVHLALCSPDAKPLTIIVPRHAVRGDEITTELSGLSVARRSKGEQIGSRTDIYLADTMGELGLFYRLAPVTFIGGTLVAHGGQNPLEPAKLGCAIIAGPHMENFASIAAGMQQEGALLRVADGAHLVGEIRRLFSEPGSREALAGKALAHVRAHEGVVAAIIEGLQPYLK